MLFVIDMMFDSSIYSCRSREMSSHPGDLKPTVDHEFIVNRTPELATAWAKHKAITNYENFYNIGVDMGRDYVTSIETVANS